MNELCDLEFCEFYWKTALDNWGTTDDGYIANKYGEVFFLRKNSSIFGVRMAPAKIKYKISKTDTHTHCNSEFVPDEGVVLVNGDNKSVTFSDADGNEFTDFKTEWFGSAYIKTPSGEKESLI